MRELVHKSADEDSYTGRAPGRPSTRPASLWLAPSLVVMAYLASALVVPFDNDLPIVDEPIYASSAFHFAETGEFVISNFSAPNAVFDTFWGGMFVRAFGASYGVLRLSTLVLVAISAPFVFLLARYLGASGPASTLALAAYLFTPLAFSLSYTFQTDAHVLALLVIATALITAALQDRQRRMLFLLAGSLVAAIAFLSRPQSLILIAVGAFAWILWGPRDGRRVWGAVALLLPTAVVYALHSRWVSSVGEPFIRELSRQDLLTREPSAYFVLLAQTLLFGLVYAGLFLLPLLPLLWPKEGEPRAVLSRPILIATGVGLFLLWAALTWDGSGFLADQTWFNDYGVGGVDRSHLGHRPALLGPLWLVGVAAVVLGSTYLFINALIIRPGRVGRNPSFRFNLLLVAGFALGVYVSSLALHGHVLDRYWLPLLPLVAALAASVGYLSRTRLAVATVVALGLGLFSMAATTDAFTAYRSVVEFADDVVADGIDPLTLDSGATWSAHTFGLSDQSLEAFLDTPGPFWLKFYAQELRPEFAIALEPLEGFEVLVRREYSSLLQRSPTYLYLLHRDPRLGFYLRPEDF